MPTTIKVNLTRDICCSDGEATICKSLRLPAVPRIGETIVIVSDDEMETYEAKITHVKWYGDNGELEILLTNAYWRELKLDTGLALMTAIGWEVIEERRTPRGIAWYVNEEAAEAAWAKK